MIEKIETILSLVVVGLTALSAIIGFIVSMVKNSKNKKLVQIAETTNEITELAKDKVIEIEKLFSQASQVLKAAGIQTGEIKKENALNYIKSQCAEKGLEYDNDFWSARIESLIDVMNVNKQK